VDPLARRERGQIALWLTEAGISQRQVHEMTGVSRDTIRKNTKSGATETVNKE
jgi:transposase